MKERSPVGPPRGSSNGKTPTLGTNPPEASTAIHRLIEFGYDAEYAKRLVYLDRAIDAAAQRCRKSKDTQPGEEFVEL